MNLCTRHRREPLLLTLSLLLLAGATGCQSSAAGGDEAAPQPMPVHIARAQLKTLRPSVPVLGIVKAEPQRAALLAAQTAGQVQRLAVEEGATVHQGQLVVQLDERQARLDVDKAKAVYDRLLAKSWDAEIKLADTTVAKARAAYQLAENKRQKTAQLRAQSPNLVPDVQLKEVQNAAEAARAELNSAEAQRQLLTQQGRLAQERELRAGWESARLQLQWCRVTSPLDGVVVEIKARVGEKADATVPLATVYDVSVVQVEARVPARRLSSLLQGDQSGAQTDGQGSTAEVQTEAFPGRVFPATVLRFGLQTQLQTGDVPVWVRVPNPQGLLRVGMAVRLKLFGAAVKGVAIPAAALTVNVEGKHLVTVVRQGQAHPTPIELGGGDGQEIRADGWVLVAHGLHAGDEVALDNGYGLPEGFPVTIVADQQ